MEELLKEVPAVDPEEEFHTFSINYHHFESSYESFYIESFTNKFKLEIKPSKKMKKEITK
jgi:hypothetical protein